MNVSDYEYLWTTEKGNWVLVSTAYGYGIVNKKTRSMLVVSDDALENALIERMQAEGCKMYSNINDAYLDA